MNNLIKSAQAAFSQDFTLAGLKLLIIVLALVLIGLALSVDNKAILALILAYEVLP